MTHLKCFYCHAAFDPGNVNAKRAVACPKHQKMHDTNTQRIRRHWARKLHIRRQLQFHDGRKPVNPRQERKVTNALFRLETARKQARVSVWDLDRINRQVYRTPLLAIQTVTSANKAIGLVRKAPVRKH